MIPNRFEFEYGDIKYNVPLKYKVNLLTGATAVGKTELLELINECMIISRTGFINFSINLPINKLYVNISINDLKVIAENKEECLILLDENNNIVEALLKSRDDLKGSNITRKTIRKYMEQSNAIYLIIVRDDSIFCPLPQDAVLELITYDNGFTHIAQPICSTQTYNFSKDSKYVICEDSKGGLDFIKNYISSSHQSVDTSNGIEGLPLLLDCYPTDSTSIFFDYLSSGHIAQELNNIFRKFPNIYNWYSLEYYILERLNLKFEADKILQERSIFNKEKALELFLRTYIIYNKKLFDESSACITYKDCNGSIICPHSNSNHISDTVIDCILATKEKRKKVFHIKSIESTKGVIKSLNFGDNFDKVN